MIVSATYVEVTVLPVPHGTEGQHRKVLLRTLSGNRGFIWREALAPVTALRTREGEALVLTVVPSGGLESD